jgi:thioesterase domain-containing protein/acyl carrier protein
LIAYVVMEEGAAPSVSELRRQLAHRLRTDALPTRFVFLDALPLNQNFKVDRRALPPPEGGRPALETAYAPPRDPIEEALVEIWREVLGLERIGIHDAFFDLGGDSLQALHVAQLIEERIETEFFGSTVLEAATVAAMAERIRAARPARCVVALRRGGTRSPFFCVHDQSGEVLGLRALAERLDDRPVHGLRTVDVGDGEVPSIERTAATYLDAIREVQPVGPYLIGGSCFGGVIAFEAAQQLVRSSEEVALLVLLDTAFPSPRARETAGRARRYWWRVSDLPVAEQVSLVARTLRERMASRLRAMSGHRYSAPRSRAIDRACRAAGHRYAPQRYPGPALLIRIGAQTNQGGWEQLIDNLETIELPLTTPHLHADVVRPPYVDWTAQTLRHAFERVEARLV